MASANIKCMEYHNSKMVHVVIRFSSTTHSFLVGWTQECLHSHIKNLRQVTKVKKKTEKERSFSEGEEMKLFN